MKKNEHAGLLLAAGITCLPMEASASTYVLDEPNYMAPNLATFRSQDGSYSDILELKLNDSAGLVTLVCNDGSRLSIPIELKQDWHVSASAVVHYRGKKCEEESEIILNVYKMTGFEGTAQLYPYKIRIVMGRWGGWNYDYSSGLSVLGGTRDVFKDHE